jgi:hypothetical protein
MTSVCFDQPLYILPFNHRGSFQTKLFGEVLPEIDQVLVNDGEPRLWRSAISLHHAAKNQECPPNDRSAKSRV